MRKGQAIDFKARHGRGDAGAALGRDIDDVKARQRRDDGHGDADADLLAQAGQGDVAEFMPGPCAVEAGRLIEAGIDLGDAGDQQHGAETQQHPGADNADGRQRPDEIAQPATRPARKADGLERLVDETGGGKHPAPGDAGGHKRNDLGQEQHRSGDRAEAAGHLPANGRGDGEAQAHRDDCEIQHKLESIADDLQQIAVGQDGDVIG